MRYALPCLLRYAAAVFFAPVLVFITPGSLFADSLPSGYSCLGSCGSLGADGVVSAPPSGASSYLYITTSGSSASAPIPTGAVGGESNGSVLSTPTFAASANSMLNYNFNYVTSDGSGYADYAWAELFSSTGTPVSLLFDARTEPTGSIVPGQGLPVPTATLDPASVDIIGGAPIWSPLGSSSGSCYAAGCGYTGWIGSSFTIGNAGEYYLSFGVTNLVDENYDSGLAIDGVAVNGVPVSGNTVTPEPSSLLLLGSGLLALAAPLMRGRYRHSR